MSVPSTSRCQGRCGQSITAPIATICATVASLPSPLGFTFTSPVGSFPANALGLHDIGGNVWQWCLDAYKPGSRWGVVRGGSWADAAPGELRSSYRNVIDRGERGVIYGFRCVLVP